MASDIRDGRLNLASCEKLPKERTDRLRIGFAKTGDVLLTHKGTVGEVSITPEVSPYVMLTPQVTYYRVNPEKLDNRYLCAALRGRLFRQQLDQISPQSTRPYVPISTQKGLRIEWYPIEVQRLIAARVAAYDDLIANNTRRIAILEEMARRIYEEWFVHFRAPGCEGLPLIDSRLGPIPQGWEVRRLQDVVVLQRGFDLPTASRISGPYPVIAATGIHGSHVEYKVQGPGVVTGRSGSLGSVLFIERDYWPLNTTLWGKSFPASSLYYAYYVLARLDLRSMNSGAAVPTLNRNVAHKLRVVVPPSSILYQFDTLMRVLFRLKFILTNENANLRAQRDLLLPKLISGEIDVNRSAALQEAAE
jgi:type I restriction enzyme S subunit